MAFSTFARLAANSSGGAESVKSGACACAAIVPATAASSARSAGRTRIGVLRDDRRSLSAVPAAQELRGVRRAARGVAGQRLEDGGRLAVRQVGTGLSWIRRRTAHRGA